MKRKTAVLILSLILVLGLAGCGNSSTDSALIYQSEENWAYMESDEKSDADVFFVCPTVYSGEENRFNMPLDDEEIKESFTGAINMEKGIYDGDTRFFAPYYRQAGLNVYEMPEEKREKYLEYAYEDVREAFLYYMENCNSGQPFILAGFSQGADMCIRLMKEFGDEENVQEKLVACYAIGWSITEEELEEYPHLKTAEGEEDTGVIISFNSEAESADESLMIPEGVKTLSINPLNWRTDSVPAGKDENDGACFTDYSGNIVKEIPHLTGAYIDPQRGALKVTDVSPEEYPPVLDIFDEGIYHLYDYQFFYRNLQENAADRIEAALEEK